MTVKFEHCGWSVTVYEQITICKRLPDGRAVPTNKPWCALARKTPKMFNLEADSKDNAIAAIKDTIDQLSETVCLNTAHDPTNSSSRQTSCE